MKKVSFGGGVKEGRMPGEEVADLEFLGNYAKNAIENFAKDSENVDQIPGLIQTLKSLYPYTIAELNQELDRL